MGSIGKISISVDNTTSTPSATASSSKAADGSTDISFSFNGIKGEKGEKGDKGDKGEVGMQGNSGVADASNKILVNDAITGGETDFLSAEVGKLGILTYDCSKGGTITNTNLQDAINSVPASFQKVGLTITYKSEDTIHRYTLKANSWSTDPANWFSVMDKTFIVQELGNAEDKVMSQKATTIAIADETTRAKSAEQAIIYDISAHNNGAVFESLSAILSSSNLSTLIPISVRHGGMTIRFVQSSDNKYVQYRLMSKSFSTNEADWQGDAIVGTDRIADGAVTFNKLYPDLQSPITNLSKNYVFAGIATPTTDPGTPKANVFYIANGKGTYTNFNNIMLSSGESAILKYNNGTWKKEIFPDTSSYEGNGPTQMEGAPTYVLTHNGENIKPMTTFDAVFDTDGKSLTDVVDNISSVLSEPPLITSVSHQLHYNGSGITSFASLSLGDFKKDDIINIEFKSIGEYNGIVKIFIFNGWIEIPSSSDRERVFKNLFRMPADGIGQTISFYSWNEKIDADISINVFTKEDGYDNITTKSLEHENIIDLNIFEDMAWLNGNSIYFPNYKCTSIDIQKGCKYKIQTTSNNNNCDAITFVDKDNKVLGKIKEYGGSKELVVNGSNLPLPIGTAKILISCEKASDISVISVQSILDDLKTKVDSLSLSSKLSSDYFSALKGKKLGIIGDSISTYEGWVPDGYAVYYENGGPLPSVENTYWKIATNELGMVVRNCSWSGSFVSGDSTSTSNANIGTSTKRINDLSADGTYPDIVLVYMGTNDFLFGKDKGEFNMSSDYVDGNISTFMNAYALLLTKIRKAYPNCKILCGTMPLQFASSPDLYINNNWTSVRTKGESIPEWNDAIKEIANAFGCGVVDFASCAINLHSDTLQDRCHPNIKGHKLMAERLIKDLLNC